MTWISELCRTLLNASPPEEEGTDYAIRVAVMSQVLQGSGLDVVALWRPLCFPNRHNINNLQVGSLSVEGEIIAFDGGFGWETIAESVLESLNIENAPGAYQWAGSPSSELAIQALDNAQKNPQKAEAVERFRGWCQSLVDQKILEEKTHAALSRTSSPRL